MIENTFSVSMLNNYIKQMFDANFSLRGLSVKGEISNLKFYPSGHVYFSLKDKESSIKAVMFYEYAKNMPKGIKDGDEVIVKGRVSVYPQRGEYQIYVEALALEGKGDQLLELELLKKKLASEGLFDPSRKRKIKIFPDAVGVICAPNSAAMADIETNLLRRNPLIRLEKFPCLVQGKEAAKDLLRALNEASNANIDTLIIGRGGGASEDLNAFNDETLVRAVANFKVPVIAAVGHEIDFTLIDYVADARASTPTGAAELATIDKREIYQRLDTINSDLLTIVNRRIETLKNKIDNISNRPFFIKPSSIYADKLTYLKTSEEKLDMLVNHLYKMKQEKVNMLSSRLKSLSMDSVLQRGYSYMLDETNKPVKSIKEVKIDQRIKTILSDGTLVSKVIAKEKNNG